MKKLFALTLIAGLLPSTTTCPVSHAKEKERPPDEASPVQRSPAEKPHAFLGVGVESLPPVLANHISHLIGEDRGVLIGEVAEDSPAQKAGLKPYDVVVSYNDQRLYSAEQLLKLVHHDTPGQEVTIGVLRGGKVRDIEVTLGDLNDVATRQTHRALRRPLLENPAKPEVEAEGNPRWESFDAIALSRLGENRFRAEIRYRDDRGKLQARVFEGTPDEIRKDVAAEKHLPTKEREHLLRVLE